MSLIPWIDGPFNGLWKGTEFEDNPRCYPFELRLADCLEAYGRHHQYKKCLDYLDDVRECTFKNKQIMRVYLMRQERARQWKAGERKERYATIPPEGSY